MMAAEKSSSALKLSSIKNLKKVIICFERTQMTQSNEQKFQGRSIICRLSLTEISQKYNFGIGEVVFRRHFDLLSGNFTLFYEEQSFQSRISRFPKNIFKCLC